MNKLFFYIAMVCGFCAPAAHAQYALSSGSDTALFTPTVVTSGSGNVSSAAFSNTQQLRVGLLEVNALESSGTGTFTLEQSATSGGTYTPVPAGYALSAAAVSGTSVQITATATGVSYVPFLLSACSNYLKLVAASNGTCTVAATIFAVPQNH